MRLKGTFPYLFPVGIACLVACGGKSEPDDIRNRTGNDIRGEAQAGLPVSASCLDGSHCTAPASCKPLGDGALCLAACDGSVECPQDMTCSDEDWCAWTVGTVGEACGKGKPCHPGLDCQEVAGDGFCTRACNWDLPCPPGEDARCVKLAQGGNFCLRNCEGGGECAAGLSCTPLSEYPEIHVCFP